MDSPKRKDGKVRLPNIDVGEEEMLANKDDDCMACSETRNMP
jgi:hypothetical protein